MSNLADYGHVDIAKAQEEQDATSGGNSFWKPQDGDNIIRVLPGHIGRDLPWESFYQHFINNVSLPNGRAIWSCPKMFAQKLDVNFDPECELPHCKGCDAFHDAISKAEGESEVEEAEKLEAKFRCECSIIDRSAPKKGIQVYGFGVQIRNEMLKILKTAPSRATLGGNFSHPVNGFDLILNKTGTGRTGTKYTLRAAREVSPLVESESRMLDLLRAMPDLAKRAAPCSQEDIYKKLGLGPVPRAQLPAAVQSRAAVTPTQAAPVAEAPKAAPAAAKKKTRTIADDDIG